MKKSILILVIYLSGVFFSYNYGKYLTIRETKTEWTKKDRLFTISVSLLSYAALISYGTVDLILSYNNEKASW